jgi:hypothetical protein
MPNMSARRWPAGPRRLCVALAFVVGLGGSLGTTQCSTDSAGSGKSGKSATAAKSAGSAKKATGSVVRCDDARSCDVIFRRATTERFANGLRGHTAIGGLAGVTTEAACLLLTHSLAAHAICAAGTTLSTKKLAAALERAEESKSCLTIHVRAPAKEGPWRPISYGTDDGRDCAP